MPQKTFRPLLAATIESNEDFQTLRFPMIASPKVDGIRVLIHPELGPVTRSLKKVRNDYVRLNLHDTRLLGLDGEVVCGPINAKDQFQLTTTGVMAQGGEIPFVYWVFDDLTYDKAAYVIRHKLVIEKVATIAESSCLFVRLLEWRWVRSPEDILACEMEWLEAGFEGVMLRSPNGPYKHGRSTLREQTLLKLKRWKDAEAQIIGFEPLLRNTNAPTTDALGLQKRTSHKDGKLADSMLGNFIVEHPSFGEFSVGSGLDVELRTLIWNNQSTYLGKTITFKYQATGIKDKPRFPIFRGFREME